MPDRVVPNESPPSAWLDVVDLPLRVELSIGSHRIGARALDLSRTGIGIELDDAVEFAGHDAHANLTIRYDGRSVVGDTIVRRQDGARLCLDLAEIDDQARMAWCAMVSELQVQALMRRLGKAS